MSAEDGGFILKSNTIMISFLYATQTLYKEGKS